MEHGKYRKEEYRMRLYIGQQMRRHRFIAAKSLREVENSLEGTLKRSALGNYEKGKTAVPATVLARLAQEYSVRVESFYPRSAMKDEDYLGKLDSLLAHRSFQKIVQELSEFSDDRRKEALRILLLMLKLKE